MGIHHLAGHLSHEHGLFVTVTSAALLTTIKLASRQPEHLNYQLKSLLQSAFVDDVEEYQLEHQE
jgi:hypothetical protein